MLLIILFCTLISCVKPKEFPIEPYIEFREQTVERSVLGRDTIDFLYVTFYFQDGDGDIGMFEDVLGHPAYNYNLCFSLEEKVNDTVYEQVYGIDSVYERFPIEYKYIIAYIPPVNANYALSGTITWNMDGYAELKSHLPNKTVRFAIYMYDRALHKSNIIFTDDIKL